MMDNLLTLLISIMGIVGWGVRTEIQHRNSRRQIETERIQSKIESDMKTETARQEIAHKTEEVRLEMERQAEQVQINATAFVQEIAKQLMGNNLELQQTINQQAQEQAQVKADLMIAKNEAVTAQKNRQEMMDTVKLQDARIAKLESQVASQQTQMDEITKLLTEAENAKKRAETERDRALAEAEKLRQEIAERDDKIARLELELNQPKPKAAEE